MSTSEIKLYNILKNKLGDETAQELVGFIKSEINNEMVDLKDIFLTKQDKVDIMRSIYVVGLIQYLTIVGTLIAAHSLLKH